MDWVCLLGPVEHGGVEVELLGVALFPDVALVRVGLGEGSLRGEAIALSGFEVFAAVGRVIAFLRTRCVRGQGVCSLDGIASVVNVTIFAVDGSIDLWDEGIELQRQKRQSEHIRCRSHLRTFPGVLRTPVHLVGGARRCQPVTKKPPNPNYLVLEYHDIAKLGRWSTASTITSPRSTFVLLSVVGSPLHADRSSTLVPPPTAP